MLSKNTIKRITKLSQKKYRKESGVFVAEGLKVIQELLDAKLVLEALYTTDELLFKDYEPTIVAQNELKKISFLTTAQKAVGVFKIPAQHLIADQGLSLVLDSIRDPGNLGTIIRLCDWFGIAQLICSPDTVDCYNPKVVQASMGSIARVAIIYTDIKTYIKTSHRPSHATLISGKSLYTASLPQEAILVMGNEANGISPAVASLCSTAISIPQFGNRKETESLNVATATSIFLSEFRRQSIIEK